MHARRPRRAPTRRDERGASAVEFALIAIPMLTLLLGIVQASLFFWAYQAADHLAGQAARMYSVNPCAQTIQDLNANKDPEAEIRSYSPVSGAVVGGTTSFTVAYTVPQVAGGLIPGVPTEVVTTGTARIEDVQC